MTKTQVRKEALSSCDSLCLFVGIDHRHIIFTTFTNLSLKGFKCMDIFFSFSLKRTLPSPLESWTLLHDCSVTQIPLHSKYFFNLTSTQVLPFSYLLPCRFAETLVSLYVPLWFYMLSLRYVSGDELSVKPRLATPFPKRQVLDTSSSVFQGLYHLVPSRAVSLLSSLPTQSRHSRTSVGRSFV